MRILTFLLVLYKITSVRLVVYDSVCVLTCIFVVYCIVRVLIFKLIVYGRDSVCVTFYVFI